MGDSLIPHFKSSIREEYGQVRANCFDCVANTTLLHAALYLKQEVWMTYHGAPDSSSIRSIRSFLHSPFRKRFRCSVYQRGDGIQRRGPDRFRYKLAQFEANSCRKYLQIPV